MIETIFSNQNKKQLEMSSSYDEWKEAALNYDLSKGLDKWRDSERSRLYDYKSIRSRLEHLRELRQENDLHGLLFALNEGIHGNLGGIGKAELYKKTKVGTKQLIEDFIEEIALGLQVLDAESAATLSNKVKRDFFNRAKHCFGQSALMMSGSGSLAYFHLGVAKVLWAENLIPTVLSGSSGGAFVIALLGTHTEDELPSIFEPSAYSELEKHQSFLEKYRLKLATAKDVQELTENLLPDLTFLEAFEKTGKAINISVASANTHHSSRLLNAITTPNVLIREAVMASCALPGIFPSVTLKARDSAGNKTDYLPSLKWVDGAISADLPIKRLSRLYGVNHYIVSQTNPHILPFLPDDNKTNGVISNISQAATRTAREWLNAGASAFHGPLSVFPTVNKFTNTVLSIINQDYMGDINILPPYRFANPIKLAPLTQEEIKALIVIGEKSAWPKIEMIRIQTRISRVLERIVTS
jgi:NTE family protein